MFNPQRKSKVSDIYMQQKIYQLHLQKMANITYSQKNKNRYQQQQQQQKYLNQLNRFKRQTSQRKTSLVKKQNHRLLQKLIQTDNRKDSITGLSNANLMIMVDSRLSSKNKHKNNPQNKKHFNSYFSMKKQDQRIKNQNFTMIVRMVNRSADIPSLRQMKLQYKKNRKLARNCRKLPSIMRLQNQYKQKLGSPFLETPHSSRTGMKQRQSRMSKLSKSSKSKSKMFMKSLHTDTDQQLIDNPTENSNLNQKQAVKIQRQLLSGK